MYKGQRGAGARSTEDVTAYHPVQYKFLARVCTSRMPWKALRVLAAVSRNTGICTGYSAQSFRRADG